MESRHLIEEFVYSVAFAHPWMEEEQRPELGGFVTGNVLPAVEEIFDQEFPGEAILRLDRVEIDLGEIGYFDFREESTNRLKEKLRSLLREKLSLATTAPHSPERLLARTDSEFEKLENFLVNGSIPWHENIAEPRTHEGILEEILRSDAGRLAAFLKRSGNGSTVVARLVNQFDQTWLAEIVGLLCRTKPAVVLASMEDLGARLQGRGLTQSGQRDALIRAWAELFDRCLREPDGSAFDEHFHDLLAQHAADGVNRSARSSDSASQPRLEDNTDESRREVAPAAGGDSPTSPNTVETRNPLLPGEGRVRAKSFVETKGFRQTEKAHPLTPTPTQEPADEVRSLYPSPSVRRWPEEPAPDLIRGPDEGEGLNSTTLPSSPLPQTDDGSFRTFAAHAKGFDASSATNRGQSPDTSGRGSERRHPVGTAGEDADAAAMDHSREERRGQEIRLDANLLPGGGELPGDSGQEIAASGPSGFGSRPEAPPLAPSSGNTVESSDSSVRRAVSRDRHERLDSTVLPSSGRLAEPTGLPGGAAKALFDGNPDRLPMPWTQLLRDHADGLKAMLQAQLRDRDALRRLADGFPEPWLADLIGLIDPGALDFVTVLLEIPEAGVPAAGHATRRQVWESAFLHLLSGHASAFDSCRLIDDFLHRQAGADAEYRRAMAQRWLDALSARNAPDELIASLQARADRPAAGSAQTNTTAPPHPFETRHAERPEAGRPGTATPSPSGIASRPEVPRLAPPFDRLAEPTGLPGGVAEALFDGNPDRLPMPWTQLLRDHADGVKAMLQAQLRDRDALRRLVDGFPEPWLADLIGLIDPGALDFVTVLLELPEAGHATRRQVWESAFLHLLSGHASAFDARPLIDDLLLRQAGADVKRRRALARRWLDALSARNAPDELIASLQARADRPAAGSTQPETAALPLETEAEPDRQAPVADADIRPRPTSEERRSTADGELGTAPPHPFETRHAERAEAGRPGTATPSPSGIASRPEVPRLAPPFDRLAEPTGLPGGVAEALFDGNPDRLPMPWTQLLRDHADGVKAMLQAQLRDRDALRRLVDGFPEPWLADLIGLIDPGALDFVTALLELPEAGVPAAGHATRRQVWESAFVHLLSGLASAFDARRLIDDLLLRQAGADAKRRRALARRWLDALSARNAPDELIASLQARADRPAAGSTQPETAALPLETEAEPDRLAPDTEASAVRLAHLGTENLRAGSADSIRLDSSSGEIQRRELFTATDADGDHAGEKPWLSLISEYLSQQPSIDPENRPELLKAIIEQSAFAQDKARFFRRVLEDLLRQRPIDLEEAVATSRLAGFESASGSTPGRQETATGPELPVSAGGQSSEPALVSSLPTVSAVVDQSPGSDTAATKGERAQAKLRHRLARAILAGDPTHLLSEWSTLIRDQADLTRHAFRHYGLRAETRRRVAEGFPEILLRDLVRLFDLKAGSLIAMLSEGISHFQPGPQAKPAGLEINPGHRFWTLALDHLLAHRTQPFDPAAFVADVAREMGGHGAEEWARRIERWLDWRDGAADAQELRAILRRFAAHREEATAPVVALNAPGSAEDAGAGRIAASFRQSVHEPAGTDTPALMGDEEMPGAEQGDGDAAVLANFLCNAFAAVPAEAERMKSLVCSIWEENEPTKRTADSHRAETAESAQEPAYKVPMEYRALAEESPVLESAAPVPGAAFGRTAPTAPRHSAEPYGSKNGLSPPASAGETEPKPKEPAPAAGNTMALSGADDSSPSPGLESTGFERVLRFLRSAFAPGSSEAARLALTAERLLDAGDPLLRKWLESLLADASAAAALARLLPEPLLAKTLQLLREQECSAVLSSADRLVASSRLRNADLAETGAAAMKWRFIFQYLFQDRLPYVEPHFSERFADFAARQIERSGGRPIPGVPEQPGMAGGATPLGDEDPGFLDALADTRRPTMAERTKLRGARDHGFREEPGPSPRIDGVEPKNPLLPGEGRVRAGSPSETGRFEQTEVAVSLNPTPTQEPADEVRSLYASPSGRRWPEEPVPDSIRGPDEGEGRYSTTLSPRIPGPIYVLNAGQVLAAPYMPRLFAMLDLTEDGAFIDRKSAMRAMHVLQFMVNESTDSPEYQLVLNKLLCGIRTGVPVVRQIDISDREKAVVEGLIQGMIQNWSIIGNTSVQGFRESFLQREGWLTPNDDGWRLEVLPRAYDMLLDRIPWSFSIIKHPWMERAIHVNWR